MLSSGNLILTQLPSEQREHDLEALLTEARNCERLADFATAQKRYEQALCTAEQQFGNASLPVATVLLQLAAFHSAIEKSFSAKEYWSRAMDILRM